MTLAELNTYFRNVNNLARAEAILENLQAAVGLQSPSLTGMPHTPGAKDKLGDLVIEIIDLQAQIEYLNFEIQKTRASIESFVAGIDDFYIRTIFRLRFERAYSWKAVASTVGGGNSENSVKSACYRYLKNLQRDDAS